MPKNFITFKVPISEEEFTKICVRELSNFPNSQLSRTENGFVINEKTNLLSGTYGVNANIEYLNGEIRIDAQCGGIGPVQQKHVNEISQMIQGIISRGIASSGDSVEENSNVVKCPKCGSTQVQLSKRGWTLATGFIGSGKQQRVCMNCMYKF